MKIVLDTNVLVSGLLSPYNPPGQIVRLVSSGLVQLCYDVRVLSEYKSVLRRPKFGFRETSVLLLLDQIKAGGYLVNTQPVARSLPDPSDEAFLECCLAGKIHYLVTGNLKHFPRERCRGIKVLSPADFIKVYKNASS